MKMFGIIVNKTKDKDLFYTSFYIKTINNYGFIALLEKELKDQISIQNEAFNVKFLKKEEVIKKADIVIVIGGDGTLLSCAQMIAKFKKPTFIINHGNIGFMSQVQRNDEKIFEIFKGNFEIEDRMMLLAKVINDKDKIETKNIKLSKVAKNSKSFIALNEFVVTKLESSKILNLKILVDQKEVYSYKGDGVIVSTATGSTAYSLSAGGPIIHPAVDAILIVPICAHSLNSKSLIIPIFSEIEIYSYSGKTKTILTGDGNRKTTLKNEYVKITKSDNKVRLIKIFKNNFFDTLGKKLKKISFD